MGAYHHEPVLINELIDLLNPKPNENYVDGTIGGAGHAWALLHRTGPRGKLLGLDLDPRAIAAATKRLESFGDRGDIEQRSYADLTSVLAAHPEIEPIAGIILDLGLSSDQLDSSARGFSFNDSGYLDMRFDPDSEKSASDILMSMSHDDLRQVLVRYGEVKHATRLANAIIDLRDRTRASGTGHGISASELVETILHETPRRYGHIHPATTVFQALRIAVNKELDNCTAFLPQAVSTLPCGGKLAVIAYHSLEDRIVKNFFRHESRDCVCPPELPVCQCDHHKTISILTKKPIRPSAHEQQDNPRSRSARLRVIKKI